MFLGRAHNEEEPKPSPKAFLEENYEWQEVCGDEIFYEFDLNPQFDIRLLTFSFCLVRREGQ